MGAQLRADLESSRPTNNLCVMRVGASGLCKSVLIALMLGILTNLKSDESGVPAGENLLPNMWAKSIPVRTSGKIPWMKNHF